MNNEETKRQRDKETENQRQTKRQRETEEQKNRKTERDRDLLSRMFCLVTFDH